MRFALELTALLSAAAASVGHANASCTYNSVATPSGVFALSGDACTPAAGTYNPTVQPDVSLPVTYTGFGFFATNLNVDGGTGVGGVINSPNAVTVNTAGANFDDAYGAWSDGTGAQINFSGPTTISTTSTVSAGLNATNGGAITATAPVTITTTGLDAAGVRATTGGAVSLTGGSVTTSSAGAPGLFATGAGSSITVSGVAVTTNGGSDSGIYANGAEARNGGSLTFSAGSITTNGASVVAVASLGSGSNVTLSGGTTILTTNDGSNGLTVSGGASLTATGVSVTTQGGVDSSDGFHAVGAYNGSSPLFSTGGTMSLTDVTIATTGQGAHGVVTNSGGVTTISGGSVTTSGDNAYGLYATGAGSSITTSNGTTISTGNVELGTGANANGVQADTGGSATLNGGSVAVTGTGSLGLFATGTGSTINATDVAVSTAGSGLPSTANAIIAGSGAVITVTGGSASTTGTDAYVAGAFTTGGTEVATLNLSGTTITATGDGSGGLFANGTGSTVTATGVTITTHGNYDTVNNFGPAGVTNQSYPGSPGGGVVTLTNSSILTTGTQSPGVYTSDGGTTNLTGDSITTSGPNAQGVNTTNSGTTNVSGGSITTSNVESDAVLALSGAQVTVQGTAISTGGDGSGNGSKGFDIQGAGTVVTVNGVTVTTTGTINPATGDHSQALYNGDGTHTGTSPTGGGVANVTNSTFQTHGVDSIGVDTLDGGTTTLSGGSVSTSGVMSAGVVSDSSAFVSLTGVSVTTTGNGATGLGVNGGAELDALNATVVTQGGVDPNSGDHAYGAYNGPSGPYTSGGVLKLTDTSVTTQGIQMFGVFTGAGGTTTILGGSIATVGSLANAIEADNGGRATIGLDGGGAATAISTTGPSGTGVVAYNGGVVQLTGATIATTGAGSTGLGVNGSGSSLTASGVTVTTQGGVDSATGDHADGAYNGPYGTLTSGGVHSLTNSSISTSGATADGVATSTGGATSLTGGSIKTTGLESPGVNAYGGGGVTLSGTTIATSGNASKGIEVLGAGSFVSASGVTVSTQGTINSADGDHAYAVYNGYAAGTSYTSGGTLTLVNVTANTSGATSDAIVTETGGVTNISGGAVTTSGQDAHALFVTGGGSIVNLSGSNAFTTQGAGASGVVASLGGVVSATGNTSVATFGGVSPATGFGANGVVADGAGAKVNLAAATISTSGPGAYGLVASDSTASGSAGAITATGALTVKTMNASDVGVLLQGNGASVLATGGGMITTAGNAISLTGGTGQIARFDSFTINNQSGDLIFADPSVATVNFNTTTANAGANNLLDATAGSMVTLNANASILTGVIRTDPTSTSNVNLTNGTTWTMTGSSTVTNLNVANSFVVFAPPGSGSGFKTLTVNTYVGSGANITMNATLGGSSSAADQIIVNGGSATGTTLLTIKNSGGLGGQTTGSGIPLVITTNGGTIAANAFTLANVPLVNGFRYTLDESNNAWYLVSTPASTTADITNSVTNVAKAQQNQMITNRVLNSILLGATQQISSCSCGGGFASVGSFAAGAQGRWGLSDALTLFGGFSYNQWNASGITVQNAPTIAGSLVYDFWKWGASRPFLEAGGSLTPYEDVHYSRSYADGLTTSVGNASAVDRDLSLFARAGWVARVSPVDEAAIYGDLSRNWMQTGGYTEMTSALNPFPATVSNGMDLLNVAHVGGQITHLFNGNIEANVSGAVAYGFGAGAGAAVNVYDFGPIAPNALPNSTWFEYGARIGYRFSDRLVVDAFVLGTAGGEIGSTVHGGVALRYAF